MQERKEFLIIPYTVIALLTDLLGRMIADRCMLPVWLDSIGTFLIAYMEGPVCGGIVGFTNNIIYGMFEQQQSAFCIIGAIVGVLAGIMSKKGYLESQFKAMTLGMGLALVSTVLATLVKTTVYDGTVQNIWENQVVLLCMEGGFSKLISTFCGQFCIEFLDKLISVELVFGLIRLARYIRQDSKKRKTAGLFLAAATVWFASGEIRVSAAEQKPDYDSYLQKIYASEEGLLSGEANDIEQTKDGKLWIATYAGLYKYDGNKFRLLNDTPSVRSVICLHTDNDGRLWVGTNDNGVSVFINEQVINTISEEDGLLSNSVKDIVSDSCGNYYIGTTEGISIISLSGGAKIVKNYAQIKNAYYMSADRNGNVVAVTDRGDVYWFQNGELTENCTEAVQQENAKGVCFTEDNRLLLGTSGNTIYVYDLAMGMPKLSEEIQLDGIEAVNRFYVTADKDIFICSDSGIAVLYEDGTYSKLNTDNFSSAVYSMLADYQGNLWFCSARQGLLEMSSSPFEELFPKMGVEASVVNTTEKWQELLFCGTDSGLVIIDESDGIGVENELSELFVNTRIRDIKADMKGNLWIATMGLGICRIRSAGEGAYDIRFFTEEDGLPGTRFRCITEAQDGRIVVAGDYGVAVIDGDSVRQTYTQQNGLGNEKSLCLLEYQDSCYVGSDGGGISIIRNGEAAGYIGKKDGLSSDVILRMVYDSSTAGVFIVTSNGLCYMYPDGNVKSLNQFPYSNNYDMVCENGICWILGSAGIYVAQASDLIADIRSEYPLMDAKRGLRSSLTANAWVCRDDEILYLCCDSGVIKVDMSDYDITAKSYRLLLDYVNIDGADYKMSRSTVLELSADMARITFEPEILNYSIYDPYISYWLEGYESDDSVCLLSELGSFSYTDLKPGNYVLHISVLDSFDGTVMETAAYTIEKEKEMYQTGYFKLYVSFIMGLVLVWITWFFTRMRTEKTILKQQYDLEYARKQIEMGNETILSIARTVDAKDSNTSQHSFRVSQYSVALARRLGYSEEKCESLRQMALLHDIGKIGIPDAILNKPAKLTEEEFAIMKSHVVKGGAILKDFKMIENVNLGALYHHERYDGTGYCHGLKGEEIPVEARIIGIADAFDAMTANRVYRKQLDLEYVIGELKRCSGTQFDPKLVEVMLSLIEDGTINIEDLYQQSKEDR